MGSITTPILIAMLNLIHFLFGVLSRKLHIDYTGTVYLVINIVI